MSSDIAEARAILAKMTPGPWIDDGGYRVRAPESPGARGTDDCIGEMKHFCASVGRDSAGIAYLRNNAAAWLSELEALRAKAGSPLGPGEGGV